MSLDLAVPAKRLEDRIINLRGQPVLLDSDLADLYGVTTKVLNQAVRRNIGRFPDDFLYLLSPTEAKEATRLRSQDVTLKPARGAHRKYSPLAFTEYGVAMLSSVLRSTRAIQVNIEIIRAFGRLRGFASVHADLARRLTDMETKAVEHDVQFKAVFKEIRRLLLPVPADDPDVPKRKIGFVTDGSRSHRDLAK